MVLDGLFQELDEMTQNRGSKLASDGTTASKSENPMLWKGNAQFAVSIFTYGYICLWPEWLMRSVPPSRTMHDIFGVPEQARLKATST